MPNTFPQLFSGTMTLIGADGNEPLGRGSFARTASFVVRVIRFVDDSEQRWVVRSNLMDAVLNIKALSGYDVGVLLTFFRTMKGMNVDTALLNTFSVTVQGSTYDYCVFTQDDFSITENKEKPNMFDLQLKFRQLRQS